MTDEAVSRRRENAAFFLRILAFGLIFTLISCAVLYVLTPKYDYGPGSMMNLPLQPRNTIDVLAGGRHKHDVCCSEYERTVGELGLQRV